jgi:hypothetical protein
VLLAAASTMHVGVRSRQGRRSIVREGPSDRRSVVVLDPRAGDQRSPQQSESRAARIEIELETVTTMLRGGLRAWPSVGCTSDRLPAQATPAGRPRPLSGLIRITKTRAQACSRR